MKILYLHQYFKTPKQGGAVRSYYLAKALVDKGHDVEMVTSHNQKMYRFETIDGINVHYLPVYYHNKLGIIGRLYAFVRFMFMAYGKSKSLQGVELCYATSTPLSIGWIALRLKNKCKIPYYFEVRDLWPEAPIQLGYIKNRFLKSLLYRFEKEIYQNATRLIALSPGMRDGIEDKVSGKYASLLPNMSDCDFFSFSNKEKYLVEKYRVQEKFVVAYTGALGKVNYLQSLIAVAKHCKVALPQVHFLVAGDGGEVSFLLRQIQVYKLDNVNYLGQVDKYEIRDILNVSDASLISFAKAKVLETNSPNKFFDGIAAGKLLAINTKGWIKDILEEKHCGFYFDPDNAQGFAYELERFINDKNLLFEYQSNARRLAECYFSRVEISKNFIKLFDGTHHIDTVISSVYTLTA